MINLNEAFFDFIKNNINEDISKLAFTFHDKDLSFDLNFAILQIENRKKYAKKLKNFIHNDNVIFPTKLAGEQATSEQIAMFHNSLIDSEKKILDMSAGLGIDCFSFTEKNRKIFACELDPIKAECLKHNAPYMAKGPIEIHNTNSIDFLKVSKGFDMIFIDPARRDSFNHKMIGFQDCQPDILNLMPLLKEKTKKVIIKGSPLLDISYISKALSNIKSIRAIGVKGECKEILIELDFEKDLQKTIYQSIDLDKNGNVATNFIFSSFDEIKKGVTFLNEDEDLTDGYLYEPNSETMKFMPWDIISSRFPGIKKLDTSTHLFYHENILPDFPGRKVMILDRISQKNRQTIKGMPVNIVSRNYPVTTENLRQRLKVKEGKELFLYACRINKKPTLLLTKLLDNQKIRI